MSRETPQRYRPVDHDPQSMRLVGGTGALVARLGRELPPDRIHREERVTTLALGGSGVALTTRRTDGSARIVEAERVIAALPPRLLEATVSFDPALDPKTNRRWRTTVTWMVPHAKFLAFHDRSFWRDAGLSGTVPDLRGAAGGNPRRCD